MTRHPVPTSPPGAVRPRAPEGIFATMKGKIGRALRLTRWGMVWERGARAFWPLLALLAFLFAVLALGGVESLPTIALPWLPTCGQKPVIQRSGRPVTKTTATPAASRRRRTSAV